MVLKQNCWKFKKCGREPGGEKVESLGVCPASTDEESDGLNDGQNAGRICWAVAGTFCGGKVQGTFAAKRDNCMACDFYKVVESEEAEQMMLLKPGQSYKEKK